MPEKYTLPRTGDVPLTFAGDLVAGSSSYDHEGPGENRYHELKLYRTGAGRYVLSVRYESRYRGEGPRDEAFVCGSPAEVRDTLVGYDPVPPGVGYPTGRDYDQKQARMEENLRFRFRRAVAELFAGLGDEVAERID